MTPLDWTILFLFVVANLTAFALMGVDKWKSKRGALRVPEATQLLWCICGGALGGWLGVCTFRHKIRDSKFSIGAPALLVVQLGLLAAYAAYWR